MMNAIHLVAERVVNYIIRRFFGPYLETFTHDELSINSNKGKIAVEHVALRVEALNALFKDYNLPFELLNGIIDSVSFEVPWSAFLHESTVIEFRGIKLVVQPIKCAEDDGEIAFSGSMFSSMFDSMASSQQMAEECIAYEFDNEMEVDPKIDSVETIVKAIETVFSNMKIKFLNTSIRVESILEDGITGVALDIEIQSVTCFDEAGMESESFANKNNNPDRNSAYCIKKCIVEGISLYTRQFAASEHNSNQEYSATMLSPGSPEMPPQHASLLSQKEGKVLQIEPVLISRIPGQQQLRLKLKQDESVVGPKVDIELSLGSFNLFLSPYQVFMLLELANGLVKPGNIKNSCNTYRQPINNRPMRDTDYALIEQQLLKEREKRNLQSQSLQHQHGWSSHALDESDEEFHLMKVEGKTTEVPLIADDLESSCSSIGSERQTVYSSSSSEATGYKKSLKSKGSNIQTILTDPLTESLQVHLSCSTFSIVLLHDHRSTEEPLNTDYNFSNNSLNFKSLGIIAVKYFEDLAMLSMEGLNFKDFDAIRVKVSKLTKANHLRFVASGVTLEINEKKSSLRLVLMTLLSILDLEVIECLFNESDENPSKEPFHMQIVSFNHEHLLPNNTLSGKETCLKMKYSQYNSGVQMRSLKDPETVTNKLEFIMAPVALDIDISLTNRIQSLLNPDQTFIRRNKKQEPFVYDWRDENMMSPHSSRKTEVQFSGPFVLLNLRIPIPDLRPYIDRLPWWKQHLRDESLVMELTDASLSFTLEPEQTKQKIEFQCRDFHALLQVSPNERVSFIRVSLDPEAEKTHHDDGFDWPRLVISKVPQMNVLCMDSQLQEPDDTYYASIQEAAVRSLMANMKKDPSPFTNIAVAFGSKLSSPSRESNMSTDEVIKPADKKKMHSFIEEIVDRSQYVFEFCIPRFNLVLKDKNFFELLYNRLSNDLLLWENTLMVPLSSRDTNNPLSSAIELNMQPLRDNTSLMSFKSCSDADSDSDDDLFTYQSVQGQSLHSLKKSEAKLDSADNHKLTKISIIMSINKGSATIHCPYKDAHGNISSDTCGRIQLCVENSKFFIASSYKGKPNESYICFLANRGHLYHDSAVPFPTENFVPQFTSRPEKSSNLIIYPSKSDASTTPEVLVGKGRESIDVLSIAAYAVTNAKQQTKTFKIAIGVSGSTLRHYMCSSAELWFNQFSDFLKVEDYPLCGYKPPSVMIELHLHLMNCAIDYRPLHLPLKTFVVIESFNLSTNISASTKSSVLRMISEELCLFLSTNMKITAVHLKNDYVCVLNTGLIDLSVRVIGSSDTTDDANGSEVKPKLEMCAMNNMINIYTCSDSCQALQKLIVYLATNGDFISTAASPDENPCIAKAIEEEKTSPCAPPSVPAPKNMRSLMVEAMKDYSSAKQSSGKGHSDTEHNDSDESFCIIEDDVGVGVSPRNGEPIIRILTDQPIKIIEDYFKPPSGKTDILKAPKDFPDPILCQTLSEMSITWHLYGGNDFPLAKEPEKKRVRYSSCPESKDRNFNLKQNETQKVHINMDKDTASFCKITTSKDSNAETVHCSMEQISLSDVGQESDPKSWIVKGGKDRDHSVLVEFQLNKVRIKHEEYPKDTKYVSRNVLVIHDIEVRDKLADSSFNKFLYWYSSESIPRQTHANMLKVKTLTAYSDPTHQREECSLKVSCQPLRLNIDQDALMFLYNFFKPFFEEAGCDGQEKEKSPGPNFKSSSPTEEQSLPVMAQQGSDTSPTFFKLFSFSEKVLIRFDYKGKRVVMEQGAIQGLLMGFAQLNGSEITLKQLSHRHGLLGWERLIAYAFNEWYEDIKNHQLHGLISGLGPINAFFQLFQGLKDFVWCPVVQYRKDGQIVRGLQRGALSLSTSTAAAFLELTSQFVGLIQNVAVYAYDVVSPGPSVTNRLQGNINESRRQSQPADIREGVVSACDIITEGISDAVRTVVRDATIEHEHKGVPGAVGAVVRQIPSTVLTPFFVSTQATKTMLHGAKHQLLPDAHKEAKDKWRTWNK